MDLLLGTVASRVGQCAWAIRTHRKCLATPRHDRYSTECNFSTRLL